MGVSLGKINYCLSTVPHSPKHHRDGREPGKDQLLPFHIIGKRPDYSRAVCKVQQQTCIHVQNNPVRFKENRLQNVHLNPTAQNALHNSRTGLWKLWKPVSRTIPKNALVHQSAMDRINADIGYNPKNLPNSCTVVPNDQP